MLMRAATIVIAGLAAAPAAAQQIPRADLGEREIRRLIEDDRQGNRCLDECAIVDRCALIDAPEARRACRREESRRADDCRRSCGVVR